MRTSSLYALTADICNQVLTDTRPADALIAKFFRERAFLGSHDRKFISDTMYTLVRNKRRLEAIVEVALTTQPAAPLTGAIALLAAHMANEPAHRLPDWIAGIAEAAMCDIPTATAFTAACTGAAVDRADAPPATRIAITHSYPDWLVQQFIAERGETETESLCAAMNAQAPITLRVNELVTTVEACRAALLSEGIPTTQGEIAPTALRLEKRVNIFQSKVFKQGWFEMQDEGSQAIGLFADPHPNWKILDACAGAGGKTLHLAAIMHNKGEIFALVQNEFQDIELRRRLRRAGVQNVRVLNGADPSVIAKLAGTMNIVLIDAPCSGTGTIRRNPMAKWRLTAEKVKQYAEAQLHILDQYKHAARPQGKIVYATCSVLKEENAGIAAAFLAANPDFASDTRGTRFLTTGGARFMDLPALRTPEGHLELLPHRHDTDGFFAAAFTRTA